MLTITIDSVDRTGDVEKESILLQQALSKEPATFDFTIKGVKTQPNLGDEILVTEDGDDIFRGTITEKKARTMGGLGVSYEYLAVDGYYLLNRRLVAKAYTEMTAEDIVQDIIDNFVTGITLDAGADSPTIKTARFNYEQPSRCIQKIANQIGWDWYIDADNVLHFFAPTEIVAPFTITDDNGNAIARSLKFDSNISELKNVIWIRGGEYLDPIAETDAVDRYEADGEQVAFPLVYRYNDAQVTLNGTPLDVGVDYLDDPADHDVLYNYQEKLVRFREDNKPTAGQVVRVFGNSYVPLIVQVQDDASVTAYGVREGIEIDRTINSVEEAELLGGAILEKWREGSQEGSFKTKETGLRVGQSITITSTRFGVDKTYKVNRITGSAKHHDEFEYEIDFITSGQTTFTDILIGLLGRDNTNIEISPDEVIQRFKNLQDQFSFGDELVEIITNSAPYHWSPVTTGNEGKWGFFTWS